VVRLASVKIVQKMKRGMVGTTVRRSLSAARISSYIGGGFVGDGGGSSTGGGGDGGRSASVICWQRGHGVGTVGIVGVGLVGGLLRT
jgi:hypothetical protein